MTTIKLRTQNTKVSIRASSPKIKLTSLSPKVTLKQVGAKGQTGDKGDPGLPGLGLPPGGITNNLLAKQSATDYDYKWVDPNTVADKNFTQSFTVASVVTVTHNLNKYPAVHVLDSAGDEVIGEVYYTNTNEIIVRFTNPFSGQITCN